MRFQFLEWHTIETRGAADHNVQAWDQNRDHGRSQSTSDPIPNDGSTTSSSDGKADPRGFGVLAIEDDDRDAVGTSASSALIDRVDVSAVHLPAIYAERRERPLSRRAFRIARPARVFMRARKPCLRLRRRVFGWNVLLVTPLPQLFWPLVETTGFPMNLMSTAVRLFPYVLPALFTGGEVIAKSAGPFRSRRQYSRGAFVHVNGKKGREFTTGSSAP